MRPLETKILETRKLLEEHVHHVDLCPDHVTQRTILSYGVQDTDPLSRVRMNGQTR